MLMHAAPQGACKARWVTWLPLYATLALLGLHTGGESELQECKCIMTQHDACKQGNSNPRLHRRHGD